jgi:hypothetical protein
MSRVEAYGNLQRSCRSRHRGTVQTRRCIAMSFRPAYGCGAIIVFGLGRVNGEFGAGESDTRSVKRAERQRRGDCVRHRAACGGFERTAL